MIKCVSLVQLTIQHLRDFGDGMVGDAGTNPHRFKRFIRTQLPDHGHIHARSVRLRRRGSAALGAFPLGALRFDFGPSASRRLGAGGLRSRGLA